MHDAAGGLGGARKCIDHCMTAAREAILPATVALFDRALPVGLVTEVDLQDLDPVQGPGPRGVEEHPNSKFRPPSE